jgi:hypothetical protein
METLDNTATSPRSSIGSNDAADRSLSTSPEKHSGRDWCIKDQCFNYEQYKQQIYNKVLFGRDRVKKSWHDYRFGASGDSGKPAESGTNGTGNLHHHQYEHHRHSRQNSIEDPAITASAPATSASAPPPTTSTSTRT